MRTSIVLSMGFLLVFSGVCAVSAAERAAAKAVIPPGESIQLTVSKGDHLLAICRQYLESPEECPAVAKQNKLKNPNLIHPGLILHIPVELLKGTPMEGRVTFVQGDARASVEGSDAWIPLKAGDAVAPKSRLKTGADGALEVTFEDDSAMFLRPQTSMGIRRAEKKGAIHLIRSLQVEAGRVLLRVREATGVAPRFTVQTPSAIASVRGTEFRIAVDPELKTFAEVLDGRLAAEAMNKRIDLEKGQGTVVKKGEAPQEARPLLPPPAPVDLQGVYNRHPAILFSRVPGALSYRWMISRDEQAREVVREKVIGTDGSAATDGLDDGFYFLRTQSIDDVGLEGMPSVPFPFRIRVNPLPPMIQSPAEGARIRGTSTTLRWLAVGDAARYRVQIAGDKGFAAVAADRKDVAAMECPTGTLPYGTYHFRVCSVAADGYEGAWSDPIPFELVSLPPAPSLEKPDMDENAIRVRTGKLAEGFTYRFQMARDKTFGTLLADRKTDAPALTLPRPKEPGVYFVRTSAIDKEGFEGPFAPPQSFEIKERFPLFELIGFFAIIGGALLLL